MIFNQLYLIFWFKFIYRFLFVFTLFRQSLPSFSLTPFSCLWIFFFLWRTALGAIGFMETCFSGSAWILICFIKIILIWTRKMPQVSSFNMNYIICNLSKLFLYRTTCGPILITELIVDCLLYRTQFGPSLINSLRQLLNKVFAILVRSLYRTKCGPILISI